MRDLERLVEEARQAQQELTRLEPELTKATVSLESGEFAASENARFQELSLEIKALNYDESARRRYYSEIGEMQRFEGHQLQLSQAQDRLPEEEEALAQAREMLKRRQQELSGQEERLPSSEAALANLPKMEGLQIDAERVVSE